MYIEVRRFPRGDQGTEAPNDMRRCHYGVSDNDTMFRVVGHLMLRSEH